MKWSQPPRDFDAVNLKESNTYMIRSALPVLLIFFETYQTTTREREKKKKVPAVF